MSRKKNVDIYHGDIWHIKISNEDTCLMRLENIRIRFIGFGIIWGELPDGTSIEIIREPESE